MVTEHVDEGDMAPLWCGAPSWVGPTEWWQAHCLGDLG